MRDIAKIELIGGLYRIRLLPVNLRRPLVATAQPSYRLAVRHIRSRYPKFQIVDAKRFDQEAERRAEEANQEREAIWRNAHRTPFNQNGGNNHRLEEQGDA